MSNNNGVGGMIVAIVAIIAIIFVALMAVNMLQGESSDVSVPDSVNVDLNAGDSAGQ